MRVTLHQIARQAKVSTSTVSRVLNGYPFVDEATRVAVLQAAQELGYPLPAAQPGRRAACTVLVLQRDTGTQNDPATAIAARGFDYEVSSGMQPVLEKQGITVRMQRTRMESSETHAYTTNPAVSGLVLMGVSRTPISCANCRRSASLSSSLDRISSLCTLTVSCDYLDGTRQAV